MAMVCLNCRGSHDQRLHCPECGARLVFRGAPRPSRVPAGGRPAGWLQSPWGRLVLGLVTAQGLYHGLRQLALAVTLASGNTDAGLTGLAVTQALQMVALLAGGFLAGSGQRAGVLLGLLVGVWNGALCLAVQTPVGPPTAVMIYGQPLLHAFVGAVAGWLGSLVWRPPALPSLPGAPLVRKAAKPRGPSPFAGPVAWVRVAAGAALAVAGTLFAAKVLGGVEEASGGKLSTLTRLQDQLITWEIKALAVMLGGALAGATTTNGLKQGLCVGLSASAVLVALPAHRGTPTLTGLTLAATMLLSLVGGWFGGQLLPPVLKWRRRGLGPMA
jgi:hypothetical protein